MKTGKITHGRSPTLTGFAVASRGLVVTNRHVIEEMEKIPSEARFVMVFPRPHVFDQKVVAGILTRRISRVFILDALEAPEPLFGEVNPDFAFAEILTRREGEAHGHAFFPAR